MPNLAPDHPPQAAPADASTSPEATAWTGPPTADSRPFVEMAFRAILHRPPRAEELAHWASVTDHRGPAEVLRLLVEGEEYLHRNEVDDRSEFYAGHFYSPVVNPEELQASGYHVDPAADEATVRGIELPVASMQAFWAHNASRIANVDFPDRPREGARYYASNRSYEWGDAAVLFAIIENARPARVVEVGSGFSSACMLDIADQLRLPTRFTFIEPYPDRLNALLTNEDRLRCEIVESPVQKVDLAVFEALEPNDILFIDSTHISKAGSDVNHELFEILPRLKPGVLVHFHDVFWPFDYPEAWTLGFRRSWNELYLLRAFLSGHRGYEVVFFNDYFRSRHPEAAAQAPKFALNPGGGLWLRKIAPG